MKKNVIAVFQFGDPGTLPGNQWIARKAEQLSARTGWRILCDNIVPIDASYQPFKIQLQPGQDYAAIDYISGEYERIVTSHLLMSLSDVRIHVICGPDVAPRIVWHLLEDGFEDVQIVKFDKPREIFFSHKSVHWQTRFDFLWRLYEGALQMLTRHAPDIYRWMARRKTNV